jgi:hypothetical protein
MFFDANETNELLTELHNKVEQTEYVSAQAGVSVSVFAGAVGVSLNNTLAALVANGTLSEPEAVATGQTIAMGAALLMEMYIADAEATAQAFGS